MKKILISLGAFLCFGSAVAQSNSLDERLERVDQKLVTSGIIYDRVLPLADLAIFNMPTEKPHNTADCRFFKQALFELHKASNFKKLVPIEQLEKQVSRYNDKMDVVPIGIINTPFQTLNFNPENPDEGGLVLRDSMYVQIAEREPFLNGYAMVIAPLKNVMQGEKIIYRFSEDLIFNNGDKKIKTLMADFGNGEMQKIIEEGKLIKEEVAFENFKDDGDKTIRFIVTLSDNFIFNTNATIFTVYGNPDPNGSRTQPVACSSNLANSDDLIKNFNLDYVQAAVGDDFQGLNESIALRGKIEPRVFYHTNNGNTQTTLLKPIVIVDGFDPSDTRKIDDCDCERDPTCKEANKKNGVYDPELHTSFVELMKYKNEVDVETNLITVLREKGYDVILVNQPTYTVDGITVDGGADFIERNAMAFIELVREANARLQANGSNEKLVVMGPSMGGQITRYALAYMEKKFAETGDPKWQHNTRIWVAFDSPNLGANVPIGDQALIKMLTADSVEAQKNFSRLQTIATNEMIFNYFKTVPLFVPYFNITINSPFLDNSYSNASTTSQGMPNNTGNPYFQEHYNNQFNNGLPGSNGFPMNLRKLAIVNGSLSGETFGEGYEKILDARLYKKICLINFNWFGWQVSSCFTSKLYHTESYSMPVSNQRVAYKMKLGDGSVAFKAAANSIRGNLDNVPGGAINATGLLYDSITGEPIPGARSFWQYTFASLTGLFLNHIGNTPKWEASAKRDQCFIPTFSSIGMKNPNQNWANPLNRNLVCDPNNKETYFDSYFGESKNTKHVELNYRGVNWLLKEIGTNTVAPMPQAPYFPVQADALQGDNAVCEGKNATYTFADICNVPSPVKYNDQNGNPINGWSVQGALEITDSTEYSVTVEGTSNNVSTDKITATFENGQTYTKNIQLGAPTFLATDQITGPSFVHFDQTVTYTYPGTGSGYTWQIFAPLNNYGGPNCAWQILSGQGTSTITVKTGCVTANAIIQVSQSNACGTATKDILTLIRPLNIGGGGDPNEPDPCDPTLSVYPNPVASNNNLNLELLRPILTPCGDPNVKMAKDAIVINQVKIYNFYGFLVYSNNTNKDVLNLDNLNLTTGNYTLNAFTSDGKILREVLIVQ